MVLVYPAIFTQRKTNDFIFNFPDLDNEGILTGETLAEALDLAEDVASKWLINHLEEKKKLPTVSKLTK